MTAATSPNTALAERPTPSTPTDLHDLFSEHKIHTVECGICDLSGVLRGKRIPAEAFLAALETGVAMSSAVFAFDLAAELVPTRYTGWVNGYPDFRLVPDPSAVRVISWRPGTALAMCHAVDERDEPVPVAPRDLLQSVVAYARSAGYEPMIGPEIEFYLLDPATGTPHGRRIPCYSLPALGPFEPALNEMCDCLRDAGIPVKGANAEYAPGQIEINVGYATPVEAADATMLLRYAITEIAARHGFAATFMATPFTDCSGSGLHIHHSLWDQPGRCNLFASPTSDGRLTPLGEAYLEGLLDHMADFGAFGAPTPNAYKRRQRYSFAPVTASWGFDNRTVAARLLGSAGPDVRIEQRDAAADANPYLVIAAQVAAGLDGISRNLTPRPSTTGDAYADQDADALPATLATAIPRLESSDLARKVFGEPFIELFLALLRHENALCESAVSDWERERYMTPP